MNRTLALAAALATALTATASPPIQAADTATLIDYRQQAMKAAAGHLRAAKAVAVNGLRLPGHLERHAEALERLAPLFPEMFPAGSGGGDSDAKSEIWSDPAGFEQAASDYRSASEALRRTAGRGGEAAEKAYYRVQERCKGCHKAYRER